VTTPEQKQNIESIAQRTMGVTAVDNQIQISSESASIQTNEALSPTSSRPDQSTNAATYSSESGQYSTGQSGAVNVNVQGSSEADRTLAQQISQELRTDAGLASAISQISISVADGKVSLKGSVKNDEQKRQIESAIQRVTGVSSVDNQLQISSSPTTPMNP